MRERHLIGDDNHCHPFMRQLLDHPGDSPTSSGSSAEVTSSHSMTEGFIANPRAIATPCRCPPEWCRRVGVRLVGEAHLREQLTRELRGPIPGQGGAIEVC